MVQYWDMDHTLIANDCDVSWKEFLLAEGLAPPDTQKWVDYYFDQYQQGILDPDAFLSFQLAEFVGRHEAEMGALAERHFQGRVRDRIYPQAKQLLAQQRAAGDTLCLLTATNEVIAAPLARHLAFPHFLATPLARDNAGRFTGRLAGEYCGGPGKIAYMQRLCRQLGTSLADAAYFGDSTADIPVLSAVGSPHAVNPSEPLATAAREHGWPILLFHL